MWGLGFKNREEITKEKDKIKKYFMKKVEITKIIHTNEECVNLSSHDHNIAEKYTSAYAASLENKVNNDLMNNMEWLLDVDGRMFSYDSISQEAAQTLSNYLDREEDSSRSFSFCCKILHCDRKSIIERIFGKKWEEQVSGNQYMCMILKNAAEVYHEYKVLEHITQLTQISLRYLMFRDSATAMIGECTVLNHATCHPKKATCR